MEGIAGRAVAALCRFDPPIVTDAVALAIEQCRNMPRVADVSARCRSIVAEQRRSPKVVELSNYVPWGEDHNGPWPLAWVQVRMVTDGRCGSFHEARERIAAAVRQTPGGLAEYCTEAEKIRAAYGNSDVAMKHLQDIGSFDLR
jgi:hypothetical protein